MKKVLFITLTLLLSISLMSCKDDVRVTVLKSDLKDYISDVVDNNHLISYIDDLLADKTSLKGDYQIILKEYKDKLLIKEKERATTLIGSSSDNLNNIDDINVVYLYASKAINENRIILNINEEVALDKYSLDLPTNEDKIYVFNSNLEYKIINTKNLTPYKNILDYAIDNEFYLINSDTNIKVVVNYKEMDEPYIFNPINYTDFSKDLYIYLETNDSTFSISDEELTEDNYILSEGLLIIKKEYLINKFSDNRDSYIFGVKFKLGSTYYLHTIHIYRS